MPGISERQNGQNGHTNEHSNGNSNRSTNRNSSRPSVPLTVEKQIAVRNRKNSSWKQDNFQILERAQRALEKEDTCWWRTLPLTKQRMPKVELHAHLSGSLSLGTIIQLLKYHTPNYYQVQANYEDLVLHKPGCVFTHNPLKKLKFGCSFQVFDQFPLIHKLLNKPEAIHIVRLSVFNLKILELAGNARNDQEFCGRSMHLFGSTDYAKKNGIYDGGPVH